MDEEIKVIKGVAPDLNNSTDSSINEDELKQQVLAQLLFRIKDLEEKNKTLENQLNNHPEQTSHLVENSIYQSGKDISDFLSTGIDQITARRSKELANYSFTN